MKRVDLLAFTVPVLVLTTVLRPVQGQDPVKLAPNNYKVLLENNRVRVVEVHYKPGDKVAMHSHPDHLAYILEAGKLKFTADKGKEKVKEVDAKVGEVIWARAETHEVENIGKTDVRAVAVELRDAGPRSGEKPKTLEAKDDVAKLAPGMVKVVFENERIRVLESSLKQGDKIPMHAHPANIVYSLTAAKIKSTGPDGKAEEKEVAKGQAVWSEAVQHAVENLSTTEVRSLNFEIKQ